MPELEQSLGRGTDTPSERKRISRKSTYGTLAIFDPPTGSSLPQPETDPERRRVDAGVFIDNFIANKTTPVQYIGDRLPPQSSPVNQAPLKDYGTEIRIR